MTDQPNQHRLFADLMPARAVKPRFLELSSKPELYLLTGLRAGGPKGITRKDGKAQQLDILVVAQLADIDGTPYEWELTAKTAYRDLRAILEALGPSELDALALGAGGVKLLLSRHGSGKDTSYTIKAG